MSKPSENPLFAYFNEPARENPSFHALPTRKPCGVWLRLFQISRQAASMLRRNISVSNKGGLSGGDAVGKAASRGQAKKEHGGHRLMTATILLSLRAQSVMRKPI
jgi:hypothetical protein